MNVQTSTCLSENENRYSWPCRLHTHRHAALKSQQNCRQSYCTNYKLFPHFSLIIRSIERCFKQKLLCPNKICALPCTILGMASRRSTLTVYHRIPHFIDIRGHVSGNTHPNGQTRPSYYAHMSRIDFLRSTHEIGSALARMARSGSRQVDPRLLSVTMRHSTGNLCNLCSEGHTIWHLRVRSCDHLLAIH